MQRIILPFILLLSLIPAHVRAQVNTDQMLQVGRNALYFEDYVLSIQYFNQIIAAKPHLARPYFYRALAKYNLDDYEGAISDASKAIERNPFLTDAYELRGIAAQTLGRPAEAVADYDVVLQSLPYNRGILFNKALAQEEMDSLSVALTTYDQLLTRHPNFDNAYIGRARLYLRQTDTIAALADLDKALRLNPNAANAYILRADIAFTSKNDIPSALSDMDMAVKLQPRSTSLYINRALLRYKSDDYFGAMSDYDYALQLDPLNLTALYNRALLRAEVRDYQAAISDLSTILNLRPTDNLALYNRAIMYRELNELPLALQDINKLIDAMPDFAAAYFLRADIRTSMHQKGAQSDYDRSMALARKTIKRNGDAPTVQQLFGVDSESDSPEETQEEVAARFSQLLTASTDDEIEAQYNSDNIRGRVQDHNISIEPEPIYVVTYYTSPTELRPAGEYLREATQINDTHVLDYSLQVTNREVSLTDTLEINRHFQAIEYYISYLSNHTPRAIDYFALGMSRITLRQYTGAEEDFKKAIALSPDFALAYFMLGVSKYRLASAATSGVTATSQAAETRQVLLNSAIEQFQHALKLSPDMALAYFNMGVIYIDLRDYTSAINAFTHAISLKSDFGEAFFNRGYVYFNLGNHASGAADLSTAGQLGVAPSYRLLKRMAK